MTCKLYKDDGSCRLEFYAKAASEAFTFNDIVTISTTGYLTRATDAANMVVAGLVQKTVASTDSDYASATRIPVLVCGGEAVFEMTASTTEAAITDIGELVDLDAAGTAHQAVDVGTSQYDVFRVTGFISTTKVLGKFLKKSGVAATGSA